MNQPAAFTHKTEHKTIETSNPRIVTIQGIKCLDGGTIKQGKKFVQYMIRLDNKPELVAKLEAYQKEVDAYNAWFAGQVEIARQSMVIDNPANFDKAENENFSWSYWDGTNGNTLTEKATGKEIYQAQYSNGGGNLTDEAKTKVEVFWAALDAIRNDAKAAAEAAAREWAASPEGKAEAAEWQRYETFKREMERADSDY